MWTSWFRRGIAGWCFVPVSRIYSRRYLASLYNSCRGVVIHTQHVNPERSSVVALLAKLGDVSPSVRPTFCTSTAAVISHRTFELCTLSFGCCGTWCTWYTGTAVHGTTLPSAQRDYYTPQFLPSIMRARTRVSATAVSYCEYLVLKVYNSSITQSSTESSS